MLALSMSTPMGPNVRWSRPTAFSALAAGSGTKGAVRSPSQPKPKPQRKYKIAKKHFALPLMLLAQQPRFGFFGNTW
jgi:hypothetical protein